MFLPEAVEAYLWTYGNARSRLGARASASRLITRRDVRAAMQWFYAQVSNEIPRDEPCQKQFQEFGKTGRAKAGQKKEQAIITMRQGTCHALAV